MLPTLDPRHRNAGQGGQARKSSAGQRERNLRVIGGAARAKACSIPACGNISGLARECRDGHDDGAIPHEGMLTAGCDGWTGRCSASPRSAGVAEPRSLISKTVMAARLRSTDPSQRGPSK